ncbi:hypothetical protein ACOI1H_10015 [Loktanella sp. DJP18]|uniref:hypothetical protein n=1 Tax=Loktanella sp. DJP18 TaxID=3409788 RepID=UPI003BB75EC9
MTDILRLSLPLTVWLASFSAIYGLQGLICSDRWPETDGFAIGRTALLFAWLLAGSIQTALLVGLRSQRYASPSAFVRQVSLILAVAALVATVWTLLPVVVTSACLPNG